MSTNELTLYNKYCQEKPNWTIYNSFNVPFLSHTELFKITTVLKEKQNGIYKT